MNYYNLIKTHYDELQKELDLVQRELEKAPDGERLVIQKRGNAFGWYLERDGRRLYIPKSRQAYAEKLAYKTYLRNRLLDLKQKKKAAERFLRCCPEMDHTKRLLEKTTGFRELLKPGMPGLPADLEAWEKEEYDRNPDHPETLKYHTVRGELVRSKSETQISYVLVKNRIPYRCECGIVLNGIKIYPDFTIIRPFDRKMFLWEHFGKLDKPSYVDNTTLKLNTYIKNGWIPGVNLIMTTETADLPLDIRQVENLVNYHFLL